MMALSNPLATSRKGGWSVEIQDAQGNPLPGFTLEESPLIWGDEIEHTVRWERTHAKATSDKPLARIAGKPIRLRFEMKDADLYSLRVQVAGVRRNPLALPSDRIRGRAWVGTAYADAALGIDGDCAHPADVGAPILIIFDNMPSISQSLAYLRLDPGFNRHLARSDPCGQKELGKL